MNKPKLLDRLCFYLGIYMSAEAIIYVLSGQRWSALIFALLGVWNLWTYFKRIGWL